MQGFDISKKDDAQHVCDWVMWFLDGLSPSYLEDFLYSNDPELDKDPNGYRVKIVHRVGDYEGGGESAEVVLGVAQSNSDCVAYVKFQGHYSSYAETNWGNPELVKARQVMTTIYE